MNKRGFTSIKSMVNTFKSSGISAIKPFTSGGLPTADMGFTTNNGAIVRSPLRNYGTAQGVGNYIELSRQTEVPVVISITVTNYGTGPFFFNSISLNNIVNLGATGAIQLSDNDLLLRSIPANTTKTLSINYFGGDLVTAGRFELVFVGSRNNTRIPFDIINILFTVTTAGSGGSE